MLAIDYPTRFFEHIGVTEVDPDTICNNAGHTALNYVFGNSLNGFDPRTIRDSGMRSGMGRQSIGYRPTRSRQMAIWP